MNERIQELAEQALNGQTIYLTAIPVGFIDTFAQLLINQCAIRLEQLGSPELGKGLIKHFGVSELHTCPYAEEIYSDYETMCDCDEEQTYQCTMDI